MDEAIEEAKAAMKAKELAKKNRVITQSEKDGNYTSSQLLAKFFKKPSEDARKNGKAYLLYKDIVNKAERKMFKIKRAKVAESQGTEAKAESLAEMLLHHPGSMLTSQEVARAWTVSGKNFFKRPRQPPSCNFPTVNMFRTIDGTCNNLKKPLLGSSGTAFKRLVPPSYEDGISSLRGTLQSQKKIVSVDPFLPPNPSVRLVSETVILNLQQDEIPFTHLLMQWGQFLDHDIDLGPELEEECEECKFTEICQPIRVPKQDRSFGVGTRNNGECLPFRRSIPVFNMDKPLSFTPLEQLNDLTAFIDGSMIYGSRREQSRPVRLFRNGLLREGPNFPGNKPSLPIDNRRLVQCPNRMDCFLCGEIRCNEQFSLTIMHTLWLREHNRCAREMATINPQWNDENLYQTCRKIVGGLIQKITYEDYLPKVLGNTFNKFIGRYTGYNPMVDPSIPNSFATAAYRYGHSLVRPRFDRLDVNYRSLPIGPLNLVDAFFAPDQFKRGLGTDPIMRGWVSFNARRMDEFMNSVLTTQLFQTKFSPGLDLASLNLQRGRDHGLSPYLIYKNFCFEKFGIASDFENDLTLVRFLKLYGSLDTAELWLSGMAETRLQDGLLGATFACIFGLNFRGVRDGDRFFWRNPGVFTRNQVTSINRDSIARVICDNSDGITSIQPDAFLSNQTRISCNRLGRVDLNLFKEDPCFIRIQMRPRNFVGEISVFSRSTKKEFDFANMKIPASTRDSFSCILIQCPTQNIPTDVIMFSSDNQRLKTTITPLQRLLPKNNSTLPGVYQAMLPITIFNRATGLFRRFAPCTSSVAFRYAIRSQEEILQAELAAETGGTDTGSDPQSSDEEDSNMNLPEEIMTILRSNNTQGQFESVAEVNSALLDKTKEAKKQEEAASLFSELEEALKKLN